MEPADDRRDDGVPAYAAANVIVAPQWSPPMIGGMTWRDVAALLDDLPAAMEPADDRRDDLFIV